MKLSSAIHRLVVSLVVVLALGSIGVSVNASHRVQNTKAMVTVLSQPKNGKFKKVFRVAKSKLGDKYVYGATGPHCFDCSGFTKYVFNHGAHMTLPRTAQAQYDSNTHAHHARRGELVFFGNSKHNITHVGLCIGHKRMIDAQDSGVKIERIHAPWWHCVGYTVPLLK